MSGLFTVAARLSNKTVVVVRDSYGPHIGAKFLTHESYFKDRFNEMKLYAEQSEHDDIKETTLAPDHYGICFVDFINKTIDYYNMDSPLRYVHSVMMEYDMNVGNTSLFSRYKRYFDNKANDFGRLINEIINKDSYYRGIENFAYALDNGWLKSVEFKTDSSGKQVDVLGECEFKFKDLAKAYYEGGSKDYPRTYIIDIPEWTVTTGSDQDKDKFKQIKENILAKHVLTEKDLLAWAAYEKEYGL